MEQLDLNRWEHKNKSVMQEHELNLEHVKTPNTKAHSSIHTNNIWIYHNHEAQIQDAINIQINARNIECI